MFAHQVIEDLEHNHRNMIINTKDNKKYREVVAVFMAAHASTINNIRKAQHFYLGEQDNLLSGSVARSMEGRVLFGENVRMPYKISTFSTHHSNDKLTPEDVAAASSHPDRLILASTKRFSVVTEMDDHLMIFLVSYLKEMAVKNNNHGWMLQSCCYHVSDNRLRVIPLMMAAAKGPEEWIDEDRGDLSVLYQSLMLLNCKNIVTEKIPAPEALNKKRRKAGKQELFDYHVLNVVVPSKKRGYQETTEPLSHNRVHLCRGHFKEYTAEHPLFGHYTGLYWWQPHVRGQNKDGVVMKDYNIKAERSTP